MKFFSDRIVIDNHTSLFTCVSWSDAWTLDDTLIYRSLLLSRKAASIGSFYLFMIDEARAELVSGSLGILSSSWSGESSSPPRVLVPPAVPLLLQPQPEWGCLTYPQWWLLCYQVLLRHSALLPYYPLPRQDCPAATQPVEPHQPSTRWKHHCKPQSCTSHASRKCWLLSLSFGKMNLQNNNHQKNFGRYQAITNNILKYLSTFPISVNEVKGILRRRDFAHVSPEAIHVRKIIVYLHSVVESNWWTSVRAGVY